MTVIAPYPFEVGDEVKQPCPKDGYLLHRVDINRPTAPPLTYPKYGECENCGKQVKLKSREVLRTGSSKRQ